MRLGAQPFLWKWVLFAWEWKMISILKAEHLPSFWNRGPGELGNSLFRVIASDLQPFGGMDAFRLQYSARCNLFRLLIFNSRPTGINSFEEFSWTTSYKAPSTQIQTFLNPHNFVPGAFNPHSEEQSRIHSPRPLWSAGGRLGNQLCYNGFK